MSQATRRDKDTLQRVPETACASNSSHWQQGVVKEEPERSTEALNYSLISEFDWNEWMLANGAKLEPAEMTPGDPWRPLSLSPIIGSPCGVDNEWLSRMLASIKDFDSQMPRASLASHAPTAVPSEAHMPAPTAHMPVPGAHMPVPTAHMPVATAVDASGDMLLEQAVLADQSLPIVEAMGGSLSASSLDTLDSQEKGGDAVTSGWETPGRKRGASQVAQHEGDDNEDLEVFTPLGPSRAVPRRRRKVQVVRQPVSEVFDVVQDGHRWRKYGQKEVKGRNYPRSYYRCSYKKCEARKQVQLDPEDETVVVTTYEGAHCHPMPQISIPSYLMPVLRGLLSGQQPECPVENEDWFQDICCKLGHELKDVLKSRHRPHHRAG